MVCATVRRVLGGLRTRAATLLCCCATRGKLRTHTAFASPSAGRWRGEEAASIRVKAARPVPRWALQRYRQHLPRWLRWRWRRCASGGRQGW